MESGWSHGHVLFDADLDGWNDLYVMRGHFSSPKGSDKGFDSLYWRFLLTHSLDFGRGLAPIRANAMEPWISNAPSRAVMPAANLTRCLWGTEMVGRGMLVGPMALARSRMAVLRLLTLTVTRRDRTFESSGAPDDGE